MFYCPVSQCARRAHVYLSQYPQECPQRQARVGNFLGVSKPWSCCLPRTGKQDRNYGGKQRRPLDKVCLRPSWEFRDGTSNCQTCYISREALDEIFRRLLFYSSFSEFRSSFRDSGALFGFLPLWGQSEFCLPGGQGTRDRRQLRIECDRCAVRCRR